MNKEIERLEEEFGLGMITENEYTHKAIYSICKRRGSLNKEELKEEIKDYPEDLKVLVSKKLRLEN